MSCPRRAGLLYLDYNGLTIRTVCFSNFLINLLSMVKSQLYTRKVIFSSSANIIGLLKGITNFRRDKPLYKLGYCVVCSTLIIDPLSTADCIIAYVHTTLCDCITLSYKRQITCRQPEIHGGEDCPEQCYTGHLIAGYKSCSWDDLDAFKCAASREKPPKIILLIVATFLKHICSSHL